MYMTTSSKVNRQGHIIYYNYIHIYYINFLYPWSQKCENRQQDQICINCTNGDKKGCAKVFDLDFQDHAMKIEHLNLKSEI